MPPVASNHNPEDPSRASPPPLTDSPVPGMQSLEASLIRQAPTEMQPASHSAAVAAAAGHAQHLTSSMQADSVGIQASMVYAASGTSDSLSTEPTAAAAAVAGSAGQSQSSAMLFRQQSGRYRSHVQPLPLRHAASDASTDSQQALVRGLGPSKTGTQRHADYRRERSEARWRHDCRVRESSRAHRGSHSQLGVAHPTISKHNNAKAASSHLGSSRAVASSPDRAAASGQLPAAGAKHRHGKGRKVRKLSREELEERRLNRQFSDNEDTVQNMHPGQSHRAFPRATTNQGSRHMTSNIIGASQGSSMPGLASGRTATAPSTDTALRHSSAQQRHGGRRTLLSDTARKADSMDTDLPADFGATGLQTGSMGRALPSKATATRQSSRGTSLHAPQTKTLGALPGRRKRMLEVRSALHLLCCDGSLGGVQHHEACKAIRSCRRDASAGMCILSCGPKGPYQQLENA